MAQGCGLKKQQSSVGKFSNLVRALSNARLKMFRERGSQRRREELPGSLWLLKGGLPLKIFFLTSTRTLYGTRCGRRLHQVIFLCAITRCALMHLVAVRIGSGGFRDTRQNWRAWSVVFERYGNATSGTVANLLAKDWSLTESDSVYLNPGNMLRLHWNWIDHGREVSEDLWTLAVIDSFLLRFSQLEQLKKRFFDANLNVRSLNQAQLRIALGLHEFRSSEIGFGSASDMVKYLSDSQDLDRSYQHVLDRISSLSSLIEARRALRNVRRDTILTGLGSVAAVFFALPPIDQSIALLVSLPRSGINILGGYEGDAHALALRVYQTLLAVLLMGFLGSLFFRFAFKKIKKPRFRRPLKRFGITWRGLPHREGDKQG